MKKESGKKFVSVQWTADLETGFPDVDAQHRVLVGMLNEAGSALAGVDTEAATLERLLQQLIAYSEYHFDTEETLMRRHHYAEKAPFEATTHLTQHRSFMSRVHAMYEALIDGGSLEPCELLDFLSSWLALHIRHTDQLLMQFVLQGPQGNSPK